MAKAKKLPSGNWRVQVYDGARKKTITFTVEGIAALPACYMGIAENVRNTRYQEERY